MLRAYRVVVAIFADRADAGRQLAAALEEHRGADAVVFGIPRGGVVVAAGHDHAILERMCERALWLRDGQIAAAGPFAEVRQAYLGGSA